MSDELAVQTVEGWDPSATGDITYGNVVELITTPTLPREDVRHYEQTVEDTVSPLEYAFHLLNGVSGRMVVDLGCGSGLTTVILAKLGAQVIAIDSSTSNLDATERRAHAHRVSHRVTLVQSRGCRIPTRDNIADRVFSHAILQHIDPLSIARQIRRILKPGGRVVFQESASSGLTRRMCGTAMTPKAAQALSRAVGIPDPCREFWLVTGLLNDFGVSCSSSLGRAAQRFDAAIFRKYPFMRSFASTLVWGAHKES